MMLFVAKRLHYVESIVNQADGARWERVVREIKLSTDQK